MNATAPNETPTGPAILPGLKHRYRPGEIVNLGVDVHATFDPASSIDVITAAAMLHGRRGRGVSLSVVRRWANAKRGQRPQGERGPRLVLPSVKVGAALAFMPQWVELFERVRARLGQDCRAHGPVESKGAAGARRQDVTSGKLRRQAVSGSS